VPSSTVRREKKSEFRTVKEQEKGFPRVPGQLTQQRQLTMDCQALNTPTSSGTINITPSDLALKLQRTMLRLKGDHMTPDGRGIDYGNLKSSDLFKEYVELSQQLSACDPSGLEENDRKAFFISILKSQ